jgi:hypothetical protein
MPETANGKPRENGHTHSNHANGNSHPPDGGNIRQKESFEAINEKLYTMVAECVAWLSDYEILPDKALNDDIFKR